MNLVDKLASEHVKGLKVISEDDSEDGFRAGFKMACEIVAEAAYQLCTELKLHRDDRADIVNAIAGLPKSAVEDGPLN